MNTTSQINIRYAVSKALGAVQSWQEALEVQTQKGDIEGIEFCQKALEAAKGNLEHVKESTTRVHEWL